MWGDVTMSALKIKLAIKLPQGVDDYGNVIEGENVYLDVLANDLGGNSISIYSLDQNDPTLQTLEGIWIDLGSRARIKIENGMIVYDTNGAYEGLGDGATATDFFNYTIQMANGAISQAQVTVTIEGQNDAPAVVALADSVGEDGPSFSIDLLTDASDVDAGDVLSVQNVDATVTTAGGRELKGSMRSARRRVASMSASLGAVTVPAASRQFTRTITILGAGT
jgi:VCBS repeat-containing protein